MAIGVQLEPRLRCSSFWSSAPAPAGAAEPRADRTRRPEAVEVQRQAPLEWVHWAAAPPEVPGARAGPLQVEGAAETELGWVAPRVPGVSPSEERRARPRAARAASRTS